MTDRNTPWNLKLNWWWVMPVFCGKLSVESHVLSKWKGKWNRTYQETKLKKTQLWWGYNKDFHWRTIYVYNKKEKDYNHYNQWFGCKVNAKP